MRRTWVRILIALLLLFGIGAFWAHRSLKAHGHPGLPTFLAQLGRNYPKSFAVDPAVVEITVDQAALERMQAVVDQARERGVIMPEGNDYVQAEVSGPEGSFKAKVRIKGKMSDHVEGDKWSFRVVARKDGGFLGMKRFSLQHPGTRNYLTEWLYHRLMAGEGLVALRYGFCKVVFNGEDLGVYAYEEHFGKELLENNARLEGPLVRFDPSLFWQHRLNGVEGAGFNEGYGDQQAAALDAFGSDDLLKDSAKNRVFEQAITLMEAFRTGRVPASAVFDAARTGRRLALLDLLGGHRSMDWSDVKFHFDPVAQRFEPVSYESVSGSAIREIGGAFRATAPASPTDEFHTALFKDTVIFAAYVRALERYAKKEWLDSAFQVLDGALDTASATLYGEFPYKELDRSVYYRNQRIMQRALAPPKAFHAYAQHRSGDTLCFTVVPVNNLPILVDSLQAGGRAHAPIQPVLVFGRLPAQPGTPQEIGFIVPGATDSLLKSELTMTAHIPGSERRLRTSVFPQSLRPLVVEDLPTQHRPNVEDFPFLKLDEASRTITTAPGSWMVDEDIVVPAGYVWRAAAPLELKLVGGAHIISRSPLLWTGDEEYPIRITGEPGAGSGLLVLDAGGRSRLDQVHCSGLTGVAGVGAAAGIIFQRSDVSLERSTFTGDRGGLVHIALCEGTVRNCTFIGGEDQLRLGFTKAQVSGTRFENALDDAVTVEGGGASLALCMVVSAGGIGVKASTAARVEITGSSIQAKGTALEAVEAAGLRMQGGSVDAPRAAHVGKAEMRYGPVQLELKEVKCLQGCDAMKVGKGSKLSQDGQAVQASSDTPNE